MLAHLCNLDTTIQSHLTSNLIKKINSMRRIPRLIKIGRLDNNLEILIVKFVKASAHA